MDHNGFMTGMLLGGALVALVPTVILIAVAVHLVRGYRAQRKTDRDVVPTREVPP